MLFRHDRSEALHASYMEISLLCTSPSVATREKTALVMDEDFAMRTATQATSILSSTKHILGPYFYTMRMEMIFIFSIPPARQNTLTGSSMMI